MWNAREYSLFRRRNERDSFFSIRSKRKPGCWDAKGMPKKKELAEVDADICAYYQTKSECQSEIWSIRLL